MPGLFCLFDHRFNLCFDRWRQDESFPASGSIAFPRLTWTGSSYLFLLFFGFTLKSTSLSFILGLKLIRLFWEQETV